MLGSLASTVSLRRLAARLPGLVCPYRQAGRFARRLERLTPVSVFFCRGSLCFVESSTHELLRILLLRTRVNRPNICFAITANSSTSLHCEQRSFREGEEG
jgi:hypothetical protein